MNLEKKVITSSVRITLDKLAIGKYVLAALNPQWNMPALSVFDYDTLSPEMTSNIIIKYGSYDSQIQSN